MKRQIRLFSVKGDELVAEWEVGATTTDAEVAFKKLMDDNFLHVMDEQEERPAKTFNPAHSYVAFRKMAGG